MFKDLKKLVQDNFALMCDNKVKLFTVNPDREKIWDLYLNGFDESVKQHHNCNCCKSFLRQYGGIVQIIGGNIVSLWDIIDVPDEYQNSIQAVQQYINSLPIADVFLNTFDNLGTDHNAVHADPSIIWDHFYVKLPRVFVHRGSESIEQAQGNFRDNKNLLQRALTELTQESLETVLELIAQGSLYRGNEFKGILDQFLMIKKKFEIAKTKVDIDLFYWEQSLQLSSALCRIRNTSIGTLLIDLSNGVDLDDAVKAFERVVAPSNYKRPTALTTPKMVEQAKQRLQDLGMLQSLDRRYADQRDLSVNDILFTDRSSQVQDVFGELSKDTIVNPKTLSKVEEVTMENFINNILPTSKGIAVLLENHHLNNFVSLITAVNPDAPSMFKWNNPFSWAYTGGIADSMKERVKAAGGNVNGVLRFSIQWNEDGKSICDFDAHAHEPNGQHIYFSNYKGNKTPQSGMLDVDMIRPSKVGVENIIWTDKSKMKYGVYKMQIHNFDSGRNNGFQAQVEFDGQIFDFAVNTHVSGYLDVAEVTYTKDGFTISSKLNSNTTLSTKEKWGLKTNTFHNVKIMTLSPNHWNTNVGNKHYMFMLENCISDESPRPFFNEFLTEDLLKERKVFEVLAGKLKVEPDTNQLSGIGFSDTQSNHVYIRVEGQFKRTIKIKI